MNLFKSTPMYHVIIEIKSQKRIISRAEKEMVMKRDRFRFLKKTSVLFGQFPVLSAR